jgi:hypothetical protein
LVNLASPRINSRPSQDSIPCPSALLLSCVIHGEWRTLNPFLLPPALATLVLKHQAIRSPSASLEVKLAACRAIGRLCDGKAASVDETRRTLGGGGLCEALAVMIASAGEDPVVLVCFTDLLCLWGKAEGADSPWPN